MNELPPDPVTDADVAATVLDSLLDVIFRPEGRAPLEVAVAALSHSLVVGALLALLDRLNEYAAQALEPPGPNVLIEDPSWRALIALNDELEEVVDEGASARTAIQSVMGGREEAELREMLTGVLRLLAAGQGDG